MEKVKIIGTRFPYGHQNLIHHIGKVLSFSGNAYNGFYVILEDGSKLDLVHFNFEYVEDSIQPINFAHLESELQTPDNSDYAKTPSLKGEGIPKQLFLEYHSKPREDGFSSHNHR